MIGGLLLATVATLFFVPVFFSVVHGWLVRRRARPAYSGAAAASFDDVDTHPEKSMINDPNPQSQGPPPPGTHPAPTVIVNSGVSHYHDSLRNIRLFSVGAVHWQDNRLDGHRGPGRPRHLENAITITRSSPTRRSAWSAPSVIAIPPLPGAPVDTFILPGNVSAYTDSPIYARTSGYLTKWYYDIGARVKKSALLAEIAAPEVDQQLAQAEADLMTSQANAGNAKTQADRYKGLVTSARRFPAGHQHASSPPGQPPPLRRLTPPRPTCNGSRNCRVLRRCTRPSTAWSPRAGSISAS